MYIQYSDINLNFYSIKIYNFFNSVFFFFISIILKNIVRYIKKMYMQYSDINLYFYAFKIYNFFN